MAKTKVESIVIVYNKYGGIATLRFDDQTKDRIISAMDKVDDDGNVIPRSCKLVLNAQIDRCVKRATA